MNADGSKTMRVYCSSYRKEGGEEDVKNPEALESKFVSCPGVCTFALTFKLEERQGQWLLYQEYARSGMTHNHGLDKVKYESIRDYISKYT